MALQSSATPVAPLTPLLKGARRLLSEFHCYRQSHQVLSSWAGARLVWHCVPSASDVTLVSCSMVDVTYTALLMPMLVAFVANPTAFKWTSVIDIVFGGELCCHGLVRVFGMSAPHWPASGKVQLVTLALH